MPKNDMVEKVILEADGEPLEGLIELPEYEIGEGIERVPGLNKSVPVKNGVTEIPEIPAVFKKTRGSRTFKFLLDWKQKNETKDMVAIRTDGKGQEIARELWTNVECSKVNSGAYDASAPAKAIINTTFLPEDIIPIDAE
jgi:hypothetical protein